MPMILRTIALLLPIFVPSCASSKQGLRERDVSYLESVRLNFEAGEEALKEGDHDKAIAYFQLVRSKFLFSKYAALSDLRIADVKYAQKKWLDAAAAYEVFIRLHPRHEEVGYAHYRVGASYFHAVPTDFFLLPPSTSKDQTFTKEALSAIELFITQFPDSPFVDDAIGMRKILFSKLAKHNQHIAQYYEKRGRYQAAIDRYLDVERLYPETEESAQSLFLAGEIARKHMRDMSMAIEIYGMILQKGDDNPYREKARELIEKLQKSSPAMSPSKTSWLGDIRPKGQESDMPKGLDLFMIAPVAIIGGPYAKSREEEKTESHRTTSCDLVMERMSKR